MLGNLGWAEALKPTGQFVANAVSAIPEWWYSDVLSTHSHSSLRQGLGNATLAELLGGGAPCELRAERQLTCDFDRRKLCSCLHYSV